MDSVNEIGEVFFPRTEPENNFYTSYKIGKYCKNFERDSLTF